MLKDSFKRKITYARISLTAECPLRCRYCRPEGFTAGNETAMSFEEIRVLLRVLSSLGVRKFRFTGGEPLFRPGAIGFLESLNGIGRHLTTGLNCSRADAESLVKAGLEGVNVSLDTLDPVKYRWLTGGSLKKVKDNLKLLKGIDLKTNTILLGGFNEREARGIALYALESGATPRFIEKMDFFSDGLKGFPAGLLLREFIREGFIETRPLPGPGPAVYHRLKGRPGRVGFIMPSSESFCGGCSKIRIKADGTLKNCLFEEGVLNVVEMIRAGLPDNLIAGEVRRAVLDKPLRRPLREEREPMIGIGG